MSAFRPQRPRRGGKHRPIRCHSRLETRPNGPIGGGGEEINTNFRSLLNDRAGKLVFYTQIALAFGWSVYTEIFRFRREDPAAFPDNTVEEQCDTFLELASEFSGHDLRSHFAHYGITNTPEALQRVADMNLPEPDPAVWTFREDPLPAELLRILPVEDDSMLEHDDIPPPPPESDTPTVNPSE